MTAIRVTCLPFELLLELQVARRHPATSSASFNREFVIPEPQQEKSPIQRTPALPRGFTASWQALTTVSDTEELCHHSGAKEVPANEQAFPKSIGV
jgi:hypothetical protein